MTSAQKIPCVVKQIVDHGNHVYSLTLVPTTSRAPRFNSGQFLHLTLEPYDPADFWPESRVFSIASSPQERESLTITYSVKGVYTRRMEEELSVGKEVWVKMPYGDFRVETAHPSVLIAGGTGLTAFTAFIESLTADQTEPIHVFYGVRERGLLIFRDLLEKASNRCPALKVHYFIEQGGAFQPDETPGQLAITKVLQQLDSPGRYDFYISGPPAMLKKFTQDLQEQGINAEAIHSDAWE
jgi:ferredoxin-NADP reductase